MQPVSITPNNLIAYFPQALVRNSELLSLSYHDVPEGETELIQELLRAALLVENLDPAPLLGTRRRGVRSQTKRRDRAAAQSR